MSTNPTVQDFKWIKGKNDLEYIKLLEDCQRRDAYIINKAVAKVKQLSNPSHVHGYTYVQGYLQALQDVKDVLTYIDPDMRMHKRRRTVLEYTKILDLMIKGRAILREMPWVFIRCNSYGDYEFFDESKKEVVDVYEE